MRIAELMTRSPITCRATSTLYEAARLMGDCDVGCLPVVDPDGRLLGIVTDRDVCLAAVEHDRSLRELTVSAAMSTRTLACGPDDPAEDVARTMARHALRRIPVVDDAGLVLGIVSIDDLAGAAERPGADLSRNVVVSTLAAIAGTDPIGIDAEC